MRNPRQWLYDWLSKLPYEKLRREAAELAAFVDEDEIKKLYRKEMQADGALGNDLHDVHPDGPVWDLLIALLELVGSPYYKSILTHSGIQATEADAALDLVRSRFPAVLVGTPFQVDLEGTAGTEESEESP